MKEFVIEDNVYRFKDMNAIELLAFKSQIRFDNFKNAVDLYSLILEKTEVKCENEWLQVKDNNTYFPNGIEKNIKVIEEILNKFLEYLKEVF